MMTLIRRLAVAAGLAAAVASAPAQVAPPAEEVPFVTSPDEVTLEMLRLAEVGPGDHVIDLGSGDGRIVILAASRFGATGLGVEIVPDLVRQSLRNAQAAGVAGRVEFRQQDLFQTDLSPASVVTMYLLPEVNLRLRPALLALKPGTRIVSHDWDMGDWKPDRTIVVPVPDKQVGREKSSKVHLWTVPARFEGVWCVNPALGPGTLELTQQFQEVHGRLTRKGRVREARGRIHGDEIHVDLKDGSTVILQMEGDALKAAGRAAQYANGNEYPDTGGNGDFAVFTRAKNNKC